MIPWVGILGALSVTIGLVAQPFDAANALCLIVGGSCLLAEVIK